jgi:hypothetical protein
VIPDGDLRPLDAAQMARRSLSAINRKTHVDILADCQRLLKVIFQTENNLIFSKLSVMLSMR